MKKKLFLEGDTGIGKSSLIRENLLPFLPAVGGFFVQRICLEERHIAFRFTEVAEPADYQLKKCVSSLKEVDNLFIYSDMQGRWHQNPQVFNDRGSACLQKSLAAGKNLILLDEMGGIELACPSFMKIAWEVLDGDIPVLGVLKSWKNVKKLKDGLAGTSQSIDSNTALLNRLRSHPQVELLLLTGLNYSQVQARVKAFVGEVFARI